MYFKFYAFDGSPKFLSHRELQMHQKPGEIRRLCVEDGFQFSMVAITTVPKSEQSRH